MFDLDVFASFQILLLLEQLLPLDELNGFLHVFDLALGWYEPDKG